MSRIILACVVLSVLALPDSRAQEIRVLASVSQKTVGMNENVAYRIDIQGAVQGALAAPDSPDANGLSLVQPFPSTTQQTSIVNGEVSQSRSYTWFYRPEREGEGSFGPVTVRVGDRTFTTEPIKVTIVPHGTTSGNQSGGRSTAPDPFGAFRSPGADAESPAVPSAEDLFIRVIPAKLSAFQGEQVTIQYELFFREGIQLRQSRLTDSWDAEGFWREELDVDARPVPRMVVEGGLRYNTIVLKRAAVFPTHAGNLSIDPLKIETEAILPTRSRDPFAQFFSLRSRFAPIELASPPLTLSIKALPAGAPASFRGAVGTYRMDVSLDQSEIEVGGSLQMTVAVSGSGNLATLAPPPVAFPGAFEQYEPQSSLQLDRSTDRLRGSKTFTYVLVARSNGRYDIPPIELSFFNPSRNQYETVRSEPMAIVVTGDAASLPVARATAGGLPVDDLAAPMRGEVHWIRADRPPLHRQAWIYFLMGVPVLLLGAQYLYDRRTRYLARNPSVGRLRRAHPLARRHLRKADELMAAGDGPAFYQELERAVLGYVGNRLDISEFGLTRARLDSTLEQAGVVAAARSELLAFLDTCDRARFAPAGASSAMESDRDRAGLLLVRLDEELSTAGTRT